MPALARAPCRRRTSRSARAAAGLLLAAVATATAAAAAALPAEVRAALARAQVPAEALAVRLQQVDAAAPRLDWQGGRPVNPASLFKLVTTLAALDLLGPSWRWTTPVWLDGTLRDGVLDGALAIQGRGDPSLVPERLWLLLRRVQQLGVQQIRGDIVLDRSAFDAASGTPGDFDGEPLRPYNVQPDALLLAYRSVVYRFTPDAARGIARVSAEPALQGLAVDAQVPLSDQPCDDWRAALQATPADPLRMRFGGRYPLACGEREWALAYADPAGYDARLLQSLWQGLGGRLDGRVRDGAAPAGAAALEWRSPPLAEVVREINKHSNNLMAQQLFLSLGLEQRGRGGVEPARAVLRDWLQRQLGDAADAVVVDNGSGLSRETRLPAAALAQLLQQAWHGPALPALLASLPAAGLDGTLRNAPLKPGRAFLKTGSLRDVAGVAGYLLDDGGRWWVLVAVVEHPRAQQARAAIDALVRWAQTPPSAARHDGGPR